MLAIDWNSDAVTFFGIELYQAIGCHCEPCTIKSVQGIICTSLKMISSFQLTNYLIR